VRLSVRLRKMSFGRSLLRYREISTLHVARHLRPELDKPALRAQNRVQSRVSVGLLPQHSKAIILDCSHCSPQRTMEYV
jgi:hypothetical protein